MRTRGSGRSAGMNDGEPPLVPEGLQRGESRVKTESAVKVDRGVRVARDGTRNGDAPPRRVVRRLGVGHDHAEPVDRAALKDRDENPGTRADGLGSSGTDEKAWHRSQADERERPSLQQGSSGAPTPYAHRRWNSGAPRTSAANFSASVRRGARSYVVTLVISGLSSSASRMLLVSLVTSPWSAAVMRRSRTSCGWRGSVPSRIGVRSTRTPGSLAWVSASAKFIRPTSAPVLTQAAALSG